MFRLTGCGYRVSSHVESSRDESAPSDLSQNASFREGRILLYEADVSTPALSLAFVNFSTASATLMISKLAVTGRPRFTRLDQMTVGEVAGLLPLLERSKNRGPATNLLAGKQSISVVTAHFRGLRPCPPQAERPSTGLPRLHSTSDANCFKRRHTAKVPSNHVGVPSCSGLVIHPIENSDPCGALLDRLREFGFSGIGGGCNS